MAGLLKTKNGRQVVDPVCGMKIDPSATVFQTDYHNRTYFFCAAGCKRSFEAAPQKYSDLKPKKKGIWERYVDRLTKATGGKPPSCCG